MFCIAHFCTILDEVEESDMSVGGRFGGWFVRVQNENNHGKFP